MGHKVGRRQCGSGRRTRAWAEGGKLYNERGRGRGGGSHWPARSHTPGPRPPAPEPGPRARLRTLAQLPCQHSRLHTGNGGPAQKSLLAPLCSPHLRATTPPLGGHSVWSIWFEVHQGRLQSHTAKSGGPELSKASAKHPGKGTGVGNNWNCSL